MRHVTLLCFFTLCLLWSACKKQACDGVVCPANSECKDGDCILTCGPNQQLVNGHCQCDNGWGGAGCVVHSAVLAGKYHFTGYEIIYNVTATPRRDTTFVNDTADVVFSADTVFARGKLFVYGNQFRRYDSVNYHQYQYQPPYISMVNGGVIGFRKSQPDTLFFETTLGTPAVYSFIRLYGFKVQ